MQKRNINKVIVLTLSLVIAFSTVASAKTNSDHSKSSRASACYVDPYPKEDGVDWSK